MVLSGQAGDRPGAIVESSGNRNPKFARRSATVGGASTTRPRGIRKARLEEEIYSQLAPDFLRTAGSSDWTLTHSLFRRVRDYFQTSSWRFDTIKDNEADGRRELGMAFLPQLASGKREIRAGKLLRITKSRTRGLSAEAWTRFIQISSHKAPSLLAFLKEVVQDAANESSAITREAHRLPVNQRKQSRQK